MKSRIAITLMLVLGLGFSTSGGALAVSGISSSGDAAAIQYEDEEQNNEQLGPEETPTDDVVEESVPSRNEQPPRNQTPNVVESDETPVAQPTQQVQAVQTTSGNSLPFTGYNAIPILVGGIALLALGMVMRHQVRAER